MFYEGVVFAAKIHNFEMKLKLKVFNKNKSPHQLLAFLLMVEERGMEGTMQDRVPVSVKDIPTFLVERALLAKDWSKQLSLLDKDKGQDQEKDPKEGWGYQRDSNLLDKLLQEEKHTLGKVRVNFIGQYSNPRIYSLDRKVSLLRSGNLHIVQLSRFVWHCSHFSVPLLQSAINALVQEQTGLFRKLDRLTKLLGEAKTRLVDNFRQQNLDIELDSELNVSSLAVLEWENSKEGIPFLSNSKTNSNTNSIFSATQKSEKTVKLDLCSIRCFLLQTCHSFHLQSFHSHLCAIFQYKSLLQTSISYYSQFSPIHTLPPLSEWMDAPLTPSLVTTLTCNLSLLSSFLSSRSAQLQSSDFRVSIALKHNPSQSMPLSLLSECLAHTQTCLSLLSSHFLVSLLALTSSPSLLERLSNSLLKEYSLLHSYRDRIAHLQDSLKKTEESIAENGIALKREKKLISEYFVKLQEMLPEYVCLRI